MNPKKKKISMLAGALAVMLAAGIAVPAQGVYAQEASPETAVLDVEDLDRLEMAAPSGKNVVLAASTVKSGSAARVVQAALGQVGYTEQANEFTKFGQWYGLSNAYWCDMFVSWCGNQAGVSPNAFPHSASCTAHVGKFKDMGRFFNSAVRGGSYTPQPGDLLFFHDPIRYPQGNVSGHVGLVLYVENGYVFTIEGNTTANRLDCLDRFLLDNSSSSYQPADYVSVNFYPLKDRRILGYGSPNYENRNAPVHKGFVDLGPSYSNREPIFHELTQNGIMQATSSHTFSPRHGMSRGDFVAALTKVCGLTAPDTQTSPYSDVSADSPYYNAVMAARSCGIIGAQTDNKFSPDSYISGQDAQAMISRALSYMGQPNQTFSFARGDHPAYGEYTIRADLASALYTLSQNAQPKTKTTVSFQSNGASGQVPAAAVNAYNRVTLPNADALQKEGYRFLGWKSSADQKVYAPGKTVQLSGTSTVFTAQWQVENAPQTAPSTLLQPSSATVHRGGTTPFFVKGGNQANVQVSSADPSVATVAVSDTTSADGVTCVITGTGVGNTTISVTINGQKTTLPVTVKPSQGSITLDTANYIMAPGNIYDIGGVIKDASGQSLTNTQIRDLVSNGTLKVSDSRTGSIASLTQLENGNFRVTGRNEGTTYIVYEIGGTHASVKIDVKKGVKQHGTAVRNTSYFTR